MGSQHKMPKIICKIFLNSGIYFFAPVAQWIERQPPELKAAGSNPAGRTNLFQ